MGRYRDVELDKVELTGERLLLRRWRPKDAVDVQSVMTDPTMREFLNLPDPYTLDVAISFVTEIGHEGRGDGRGLGCAVVERDSGRLVGAAALRLAGEPNIGYWIAPAARGHGYAAEATRTLLDWGFGLGVHRVRLECDVRNLASARTALAAGFQFEGVARAAGAELSEGDTGDGDVPDRESRRHADMARFARLHTDPDEPIPPSFPALSPGGLTDGVLTLRPVQPEDGPGLFETEDELAERWALTAERLTAASCQTRAARSGLDWLVGGQARMAIVDTASGSFAGFLNVRAPGPPGVGAFGYGVHPRFRGRGFTARALRLFVPWAFDVAGFARLELGAKRANVASQRAALAAGFVPEGEYRSRLRNPDGSFSDELGFALLAPGGPPVAQSASRISP